MADLLAHILATYGLWFVVTQSDLPWWGDARTRLGEQHRWFAVWTMCPVCSGFWMSLALVLLRLVSAPLSLSLGVTLTLAGTAGCYLIETMVRRLEAR